MTISSSANIDYSNLYNQSYANLYNLINDNVSNPTDSVGTRKFVYQREPRDMGREFNGFPLIIIPNNSIAQANASIDASRAFIDFEFEIIVWTQDKTSDGSGNPAGAEQLNTISDSIIKTINTKANRDDLRGKGLSKLNITESPADHDEFDGRMLFSRQFTLTYRTRTKVIA